MSKVAIKGNPLGTGTFTIEAPNSDTDSTVLLPVGGGSVVLTDATQTLTNKSISAAQVNSGTLDSARIPDLAATKITSGTFDAARIPSLDASKITTGTVATARLASGTANSTTFLRGDSTWQTISTTPTTDQVLSATAGASVGAVGTYAFLGSINQANLTVGTTYAGSGLRYVGFYISTTPATVSNGSNSIAFSQIANNAPAGTWRCMGSQRGTGVIVNGEGVSSYPATMFLRIS